MPFTKEHDLSFEFDGYTIEATIVYSQKDYMIKVRQPTYVELPGRHIMQMLPVVYAMPNESVPTQYQRVNLLADAKKDIERYFSKPENYPDFDEDSE